MRDNIELRSRNAWENAALKEISIDASLKALTAMSQIE
jgi:hypothetical protein